MVEDGAGLNSLTDHVWNPILDKCISIPVDRDVPASHGFGFDPSLISIYIVIRIVPKA